MQVKYIVYQRKSDKTPQVDIWKTNGEMLHHIYRHEHNIAPNEVSSVGYLIFNPKKEIWELEHYPLYESPSSIMEAISQMRKNKRDKILIQKQIHRCDFLKDSELQMACYKQNKKIKQERLQMIKKYLFGR
jgi:hypothetical protein